MDAGEGQHAASDHPDLARRARVGTTYEDSTQMGRIPGEIVEFEPPRRLVYHWWDRSSSGRTKTEGWPGYTLEAVDGDTTLVRHHATMQAHGAWSLASPVLRMFARRERTAVLDALQKSFETTLT